MSTCIVCGGPTRNGRSVPVSTPMPQPVDWEEYRVLNGWPTPNHMRRAADALDELAIPQYGNILRWVADACDTAVTMRVTP